MKIHILGVCGTFMAGVAVLARALGHAVSGSDNGFYPPMGDQLRKAGIELVEGYSPEFLERSPELVIVGNVLSRGNPAIEALLDAGIDYISGPQWLYQEVLRDKWVIAVAGTHGKTTTTAMLAHVLEQAGLAPGFLIGGVALDFEFSARLGGGSFFVVEADEYDTAFFDKRSKFVHYRPRTLVLNNLEYDHADIFPDLAAIQYQFHQLLRSVPRSGQVLVNGADSALAAVLERGCWSEQRSFGVDPGRHTDWQGAADGDSGEMLAVTAPDGARFTTHWGQRGLHNVANATAAVAGACHVGVPPATSVAALGQFSGVARRLQVVAANGGVTLYDDFAHHPSAIRATLGALRQLAGSERVIAVLEPGSNTMRMGVHTDALPDAVRAADRLFVWQRSDLKFDPGKVFASLGERLTVSESVDCLAKCLLRELQNGDHVVLLSNGSFGGLNDQLVAGIDRR